jgi:hypothetical protein
VQPIPPSAAAHLVPKHTSKGMYNRVETRPGLDAFAANASGVSAALGPLLAWAQAVVPARAHASTPLFFMGTGGLRRLPAAQQQTLLAEVQKQLGQSGFRWVWVGGLLESQQRVSSAPTAWRAVCAKKRQVQLSSALGVCSWPFTSCHGCPAGLSRAGRV